MTSGSPPDSSNLNSSNADVESSQENSKAGNEEVNRPAAHQGTEEEEGGSQTSSIPSAGCFPVREGYMKVDDPGQAEGDDFDGIKGTAQPRKYRDLSFAFLFFIHAAAIIFLFVRADLPYSQLYPHPYRLVTKFVAKCSGFSFFLSTFSIGWMIKKKESLMKVSIGVTICMSVLIGLASLVAGQIFLGTMGIATFVMGVCYTFMVWDKVPFAATNLVIAITAVATNYGLFKVAFMMILIGIGWSMLITIAVSGALNVYGISISILFLLSYYWVFQILKNIVHVTTSGVIGAWWFIPEEATPRSTPALRDSYVRAFTHSFGSICFGSLLVPFVQTLRNVSQSFRDTNNCGILLCVVDCLLVAVRDFIQYVNKWAFVYMGLYGYSFVKAGKNVIILFENKGWAVITTNRLAENVLFMINLNNGLLSSLVGIALAAHDKGYFKYIGYQDPYTAGSIFGFLIGFMISSILVSVINSALNTVIVCYAESAEEFQKNHPGMSDRMRETWSSSYPHELGEL